MDMTGLGHGRVRVRVRVRKTKRVKAPGTPKPNMTKMGADLERSTYQARPAYRYIRASDRLPGLDVDEAGPMARIKLFDPTGSWTWYIAAYDPETRTAYGLVDGLNKEYGNISMAEVVAYRGRFGLPIERDLYWQPKPMSQV